MRVQLALAANEVPQVPPVPRAKSALEIPIPEMVRIAGLPLISVTVWAALLVPASWSAANARLAGLSRTAIRLTVAEPQRLTSTVLHALTVTVCGLGTGLGAV